MLAGVDAPTLPIELVEDTPDNAITIETPIALMAEVESMPVSVAPAGGAPLDALAPKGLAPNGLFPSIF